MTQSRLTLDWMAATSAELDDEVDLRGFKGCCTRGRACVCAAQVVNLLNFLTDPVPQREFSRNVELGTLEGACRGLMFSPVLAVLCGL